MLMKAWTNLKREVKTRRVQPTSSKDQGPKSESCVHKEDSIGREDVSSTLKSTEKKSSSAPKSTEKKSSSTSKSTEKKLSSNSKKSSSKYKEKSLNPKQQKRRSFSSEPKHSKSIQAEAFERDDLKREHFPSFEAIENIYDSDTTQSSMEEEDVAAKHKKYCMSKEDQDVAVFMKLTERMSLESLKFILQGHVSELKGTIPAPRRNMSNKKTSSFRCTRRSLPKPGKQFRFAEVSNNEVRTVVYEIENWRDAPGVWWTEQEMADIRHELIDMVQFFRKHESDYLESVQMVAEQNQKEFVLENHMKRLTKDYDDARGLESHIVQMFSDHRKEFINSVLDEQDNCEDENLGYNDTCVAMRQVALAYSHMPNRFAQRIARCDEISALKASMSKWKPEN